jgi:hypothetical protein
MRGTLVAMRPASDAMMARDVRDGDLTLASAAPLSGHERICAAPDYRLGR